jgi:hypothetical protein
MSQNITRPISVPDRGWRFNPEPAMVPVAMMDPKPPVTLPLEAWVTTACALVLDGSLKTDRLKTFVDAWLHLPRDSWRAIVGRVLTLDTECLSIGGNAVYTDVAVWHPIGPGDLKHERAGTSVWSTRDSGLLLASRKL